MFVVAHLDDLLSVTHRLHRILVRGMYSSIRSLVPVLFDAS